MRKLLFFVFLAIISFLSYEFYTANSIPSSAAQHDSIYEGPLTLVNQDNDVKSKPSKLIEVPTNLSRNVLIENKLMLDASTVKAAQQLFQAAELDGIQHFKLNSAYRDENEQAQLYEQYGINYSLPAGFSEHQTGYALDIGSTKGSMGESNEGIWLANNAIHYGFILRYPAHKVDITGISFEPWHFRYVGVPHSQIMAENDFVLEEYIEQLQLGRTFSIALKGRNYKVSYYAEEGFSAEDISSLYTVSGDNIGGYVVTTVKDD